MNHSLQLIFSRRQPSYFLSILIILCIGMAIGLSHLTLRAAVRPATNAVQVTDKEIVRNGNFGQGNGAWTIQPILSGVQDNLGEDGSAALALQHFSDDSAAQAYQQLHLPTTLTAATLNFNYRIKPGASPGTSTTFGVQILTEENTVLASNGGDFNSETGWLAFSATLDATTLANIQSAVADGKRIYLQFFLQNANFSFFEAYVDNASLIVSGDMPTASSSGTIAFLSENSNARLTVERIEPTGGDRTTLWTHPEAISPQLYDVAWNPAATELAFTSNHEQLYSAFHSDIYGIKPNGTGLRRISNPPIHADWPNGKATGTVTGKVRNDYSTGVAPFVLFVEGAKAATSLSIPEFGQSYDFTVPDVVDLGAGVLQYVVYSWSSNSCANGKEYAAAVVDVVAGQTVDVGTLTFNGFCNRYDAAQMAWSHDGSRLGALIGTTSHQFNATGEAIGRDLYSSSDSFASDLAWSPTTNEILTTRLINGTTYQIFRAQADGSSGTQIAIDNQNDHAAPAWLPDASGFVFTYGSPGFAIGHFDLGSQQATVLAQFANEIISNLSVSPTGRYIVFERRLGNSTDLWILDRTNPHLLWPLTEDGQSRNPDWSRVDPTNPADGTPTPTATTQPGTTPTATATSRPTTTPDPSQTEKLYMPLIAR